jgi:uncharacterized phiE125 gp8 family phage protein
VSPDQYSLAVAPTFEPISFDEMADHLRLIDDTDEEYVTGLIAVAREYVEGVTGRVAVSSTYRVVAQSWADLKSINERMPFFRTSLTTSELIPLFRTPLISITSIKYYPPGVTTQTTLSSTNYSAIVTTSPGQIFIPSSVILPDVEEERPDAIEILFVAGHSTIGEVPATLRHAIKLLAAHFYETRQPVITGTIVAAMPYTLTNLILNQRVGGFFQ